MSFSASPLVPGQPAADDESAASWAATAAAVAEAVRAALSQIPSPAPLTVGDPLPALTDPAEREQLLGSAAAAITGYLAGAAEGKALLVIGQDLTDALAATPFGSLEPAQALKPALETIADALGGRLDGDPASTAVEGCLDVLAGGTTVLVPLLAGEAVTSVVGISLTGAPKQAGGAAAPSTGSTGQTRPGGAAGTAGAASSWGIDLLRDVEMEVTCELGRTRMTVRQLLALAPGDVVELDRLAGAPADLLVNGTLLARGEVVVVDESFGLRITEIVTRDAT